LWLARIKFYQLYTVEPLMYVSYQAMYENFLNIWFPETQNMQYYDAS
jgi:hypothetical protein